MPSRSSWTSRWWWIVATYLTNKPFLVVLAFAVSWSAGVLLVANSARTSYVADYPSLPRGALLVNSQETLDHIRSTGRQKEVDSIDLGALWYSLQQAGQSGPPNRSRLLSPPPSFYDVLDEFPNLTHVRANIDDPQAALSRIVRLKHLQTLSVFSASFHDLSPLAQLAELKQLDLTAFQPLTGIAALESLPHLEMLTVHTEDAVDAGVLAKVARLPHLRTLVLAFPGAFDARKKITVQSLAPLDRAASLKLVYAGGQSLPRELDLLAMAREALPHVQVRPAVVPRQVPLIGLVAPCLILGLAVGAILANQFRCAVMRLAPDFVFRHAAVAAGWMLTIGIGTTAALWVAGYPILASLLFSLATGCFAVAACAHQTNYQRAEAKPNAIGQWVFGGMTIALVAMMTIPAVGESLRESNVLVLVGTAAAVPIAIGVCSRSLRELSAADSSPPGGLNRKAAQLSYRPGWMFATEQRERQIESWPRAAAYWSWWKRIQRWRAGNPPFNGVRYSLFACGAAVVSAWLISQAIPQVRADMFRSQLLILPPLMMAMAAMRIANDWSNRTRSLGFESLWPCDLKQLQREWSAALVVDVAPIVAVIAIVEALAVNTTILPQAESLAGMVVVDWPRVPSDLLVFLLVGIPAFVGVAAMLIVIRRTWVRIVAVFAAFLFGFIGTGMLTAWQAGLPLSGQVMNPHAFVGQLWLPALLGAIVACWMWRRWLSLELERPA